MIQTILKKYLSKTDGKFPSFDSNKRMNIITSLTCKTPKSYGCAKVRSPKDASGHMTIDLKVGFHIFAHNANV